jgi:uncharacterized protein YukE
VAGRWFGVRGRRFVRPTLTLVHKGAAVRALADLEHKPWAAEDGEVWTAAFALDESLDGAREIELSVAPDIIVELRPKGKKLARPGDSLTAGAAARAPRFKGESIVPVPAAADGAPDPEAKPARPPRRRVSPSAELERLGARLASANHALGQERERRAALAKSLEDERTTNRELRTELGRAHSELEVAGAARAEAVAVEAELEEARGQLREVQRGHQADTEALSRRHEDATQAFSREHEQLTQAHGDLEDELRRQTEALESTREALAAERAESGRLRNRFAQLQETGRHGGSAETGGDGAPAEPRVSRRATSRAAGQSRAGASRETVQRDTPEQETSKRDTPEQETSKRATSKRATSKRATSKRATSARATSEREASERGSSERGSSERETSGRAPRRRQARQREPDPTETQRFDVLGLQDELELAAPPSPSRSASRRAGQPPPDPPGWTPPVADRLRPLNPSLRHRTWWFGRLLALIVLCGVIAAVYVVLHSTVLH